MANTGWVSYGRNRNLSCQSWHQVTRFLSLSSTHLHSEGTKDGILLRDMQGGKQGPALFFDQQVQRFVLHLGHILKRTVRVIQ